MRAFMIISYFMSLELVFATNIVKKRRLDDLLPGIAFMVPHGPPRLQTTTSVTASTIDKKSTFASTIEDLTTIVSTTNVPSTTSSRAEVPSHLCPPEKSLHTKEDIKMMIDYRVKTLSIYNSINNSYHPQAVAMREKHMNDINQFLSWYQSRPKHLKHNLENIGFLRNHVEPTVKNVAVAINQYPQLQEKFDIDVNRSSSLLIKLNRYKHICENNCETKLSYRINKRSNFNGYYCTSLEALNNKIKSELTKFEKKLSSIMVNRLNDDDKLYAKKINERKNKLKDAALKEFGRTMYDILDLQDEYYHFIQDLMEMDANSEVYNIKQMSLFIDTELLELNQRIENYGTHCRTCNTILQRYMTNKVNNHIGFQDKENKSNDLVDHLLNLKYEEIQNSINKNYSNIFTELDSILNKSDPLELYMTDLKPIQDDITKMLETQRTNFNELKNIASPSAVKKLVKLSSDSKQLLSEINKELDGLDKFSKSGRSHNYNF